MPSTRRLLASCALLAVLGGCALPVGRGAPSVDPARMAFAPSSVSGIASRPGATHPSAGCSVPGTPPPLDRIRVGGRERRFILVAAPAGAHARPPPLVFAFHGRTNSNRELRGYLQLERAVSEPVVFVYPSGVKSGRTYSWSSPQDRPGELRDFAFFDALLEAIAARHCVDLARVLVVGHSLGAWFANSVACARAHRVRAVATVGGGIGPGACSAPLAAMVMHNPNDRLAPFAGGEAARDRFVDAAGLANAPPGPVPGPFACRRYGAPDVANPVIWCPHERNVTWRGRYYPHQWPRGAGQAIMDFLLGLPPAAT